MTVAAKSLSCFPEQNESMSEDFQKTISIVLIKIQFILPSKMRYPHGIKSKALPRASPTFLVILQIKQALCHCLGPLQHLVLYS